MNRLLCGLVITLLLCCAAPARAQGEPGAPFRAVRLGAGETIKLDGRLDHPAWARAPVHSGFVAKAPVTGAAPRAETRVQVLFDDQALYIGVRAIDANPQQIRAPLVRHDFVNRTQDFVVVYLDTIGTRQSAQFFRVNAAGSTADGMQTAADDSEDFAPDFDFDAAAARDASGYTAVLRIPFASLRFSSEGEPRWRMMVVRRTPRDEFHMDSSVLIPREAPNFIATMQPLEGVVLPPSSRFLTLRPSLTLRREQSTPAGAPSTSRQRAEASLDVKWRLRPEWVVDATLNPDFSQLALDVPQLAGNTRYALSFPEKRPFFFESSDLLRSPSEAFYTRSFTAPRWGLRSTWRGLALAGSAFAIDDAGGGQVLLPGPFATDVAEQPASKSAAARLKLDTGAVQVGGIAIARRYAGERGANSVAGPDLGWQIDDLWRARAQWLHSETSALADGAGGLRRGPTLGGDRAVLKINRLTDMAETALNIDQLSSGFRHDSGFVNQAGVRSAQLFQSYGWHPLGPLNEFYLNLHLDETRTRPGGIRVSHDLYPGFWLAGAHNLEWLLLWHGRAQLRTAAEAPLLDQRYWHSEFTVTPAAWVPFLTLTSNLGRIADVRANRVRPGGDFALQLTTRPLDRLEFEPRLNRAWLKREDGAQAYRETAAQVLAVWHFDARQTLRAIVQRTRLDRSAEPGVAAARDAGSVGSLTYAWRQSAGTVLYVGASRSRLDATTSDRANEVFVKLQVDPDSFR